MRSLPVAVVTALAIGVAQSQLTRLHPSGWGAPLLGVVLAGLGGLAGAARRRGSPRAAADGGGA
mgnify:CR=1 FL=1